MQNDDLETVIFASNLYFPKEFLSISSASDELKFKCLVVVTFCFALKRKGKMQTVSLYKLLFYCQCPTFNIEIF